MFQITNRFQALACDYIYNEYEDTLPYNMVVEGKWLLLEPSAVAKIIKYRFSDRYDGKLTLDEINSLKEKFTEKQTAIDKYRKEHCDRMRDLGESSRKQKLLCSVDPICMKKTGSRCSHYYDFDQIEEEAEDEYQYNIQCDKSELYTLESKYKRALAIKENRLEEYEQEMEDEWDEFNFNLGQRISC
jgi:hypothetical protein